MTQAATATPAPRVQMFSFSLSLLIEGDNPTTRDALRAVAKALDAAGIRVAPGRSWEVRWHDPNPKRRPHEMASKHEEPCPECGSRWQRPAIDTSDPEATEFPTFSACAYCGRRMDSPTPAAPAGVGA